MPCVVMPMPSGIWLGMSRYEGQMDRMICVMAVDPVYVWMACQKRAVMARVTTAKREKYQPNEARIATGKGMCRRAPMMPLSTRGTVQTRLPKMMQTMASRLWRGPCVSYCAAVSSKCEEAPPRCQETAAHQVRPRAMMEAGAIQL